MSSFLWPYSLLMLHLLSGILWIIVVNRKLEQAGRRQQWTKYLVYLLLVNLVWFVLVLSPKIYPFLGWFIMLIAGIEFILAYYKKSSFFPFTLILLVIFAGFERSLHLSSHLIIYCFFLVVVFDATCQVVGQLVGKRKLFPSISPKKTWEGLLGGMFITLASSLLIRSSFGFNWADWALLSMVVLSGAFIGDLLASLVKRSAGISNFSRLLPGHGGILDRFDSLIMAGAFLYIYVISTGFPV